MGGERALTEKLSIQRDAKTGAVKHIWAPSKRGNAMVHNGRELQASNTSYAAQLVKTTDGGKTWTSQFFSTSVGYFNGIGACRTARFAARRRGRHARGRPSVTHRLALSL